MNLPVLMMMNPAPGNQGLGSMLFFGQIVLIFVIFYFLILRPQRQQQKKHEERLKQLKKGDEIVTAGGIVGEVVFIKDDKVTIRSGESKLVVERSRISQVGTSKAPEAAAAS